MEIIDELIEHSFGKKLIDQYLPKKIDRSIPLEKRSECCDNYKGITDDIEGTWLYWNGKKWVHGKPKFLNKLSHDEISYLNNVVYHSKGRGWILDLFAKNHPEVNIIQLTTGQLQFKAVYNKNYYNYIFLAKPS